jgi:hypothetical protein
MSDMRSRLRGLGVSEARLAAIGMGAPSAAPAPVAATLGNVFTRSRDAQHTAETDAARASKRAALAAMPDSAVERHAAAVATYRRYRDSTNAIERAHIRKNFPDLELGRQLDELDPEPPSAA